MNEEINNGKKNKHMIAFEQDMRPIGFNLQAQLSSFHFNKSAFAITSKFINRFMTQDDSNDVSNSDD